MRTTPVGVAQGKVLNAIGKAAADWQEAEQIFSDLGITVSAKRVGRSSEPVVEFYGIRGGFNIHGEGETYDATTLTPEQRQALQQFVK